ncbi:MAG: S26 family signal peptidase [Methanocorpusculum sp.]|nr:S26 family signal peptidase [Methanocorpusculum sp.]
MSLRDIIQPENTVAVFIRDVILVLLIVGGIGVLLYAAAGTWPALVAVESGSMETNLSTYSLVFVVDENRFGGWMPQDQAITEGANPVFNWYGDVIVYQPNGMKGVTPIIHRAITVISAEEAATVWGYEGSAAHGGVITKGDNEATNALCDQMGQFPRYGITRMEPVKEEWIVGKALFAIPLVGWIPLNMIPTLIIAVILILALDLGGRLVAKKKGEKSSKKADGKKRR